MRAPLFALMLVAAPLSGQGRQGRSTQSPKPIAPATAAVTGTVYARTQGGQVIRGAGVEVFAVDARPEAVARMRERCSVTARVDSALWRREWTRMDSLTSIDARMREIKRMGEADAQRIREGSVRATREDVVAIVTADVDGRFRLSLPVERPYLLVATLPWTSDTAEWAVPLRLGSTEATLDLSHANVNHDRWADVCSIPVPRRVNAAIKP